MAKTERTPKRRANPGKVVPREEGMLMFNLWRSECHVKLPSGDNGKYRWTRMAGTPSLKAFARQCLTDTGSERAEIARRWLHNKKVNTSVGHQAIGSTRKKKADNKAQASASKERKPR